MSDVPADPVVVDPAAVDAPVVDATAKPVVKSSTTCDHATCSWQAVTLLVDVDSSGRVVVVARRCSRHDEDGSHPLLAMYWSTTEIPYPPPLS